jgi:aryl-alcohol dehydrogenase-like predicted oxidoreductase
VSLRRLQTDRIDLYQFHNVDRTVQWEEIWQAVEKTLDELFPGPGGAAPEAYAW